MENRQEKKEGFMYPEFQYLAEKHPELYEHFISIGRYPIEKGKCLDLKTKLLIPMVILAHRGQIQGVATHIRRALGLGMTEEEILEAFLVALLPGGAPTMVNGLRALLEAKKERSGNK
jgi:alkylhydroperoxidase/carboxymuconolactone decarboxylase family protein YurZ